MKTDAKKFHPLEIKVLRALKAGEAFTAADLTSRLGLVIGQINQAVSWLAAKGLIDESSRETRIFYEITPFGRVQQAGGTAAERLFESIKTDGPATLVEVSNKLKIENRETGSAFGLLAKEKVLKMGRENRVEMGVNNSSSQISGLRALLDRAARESVLAASDLNKDENALIGGYSKKRGSGQTLFRVLEKEMVSHSLSPAGIKERQALSRAGLSGEEVGALTAQMLITGSWKDKNFRAYNIDTPASRVLLGRLNPYAEYLQWVKDKLCGLGFEEFDGPLVETEFWNSDALFMPQFHSARDIHDVYSLASPGQAREIEAQWLDRVAAAHENGGVSGSRGWQYAFDRDFTRRLIMRSQGTALSAKQLPKAKIPGKYFGILRCFRHDQVDATHGADFYQTEGIIIGEDVNLRTLLGVLKMFAKEVAGAEEVKYVPGYFPFTEPSVEVHIKHPVLGWFEMGGSGIFRPEVYQSLGLNTPVLAWGLGIDRMALMHLGLNDLRELFTHDIEKARLRRVNNA